MYGQRLTNLRKILGAGIEDCFGAGDRFRTDDLVLGKFFAETGSHLRRSGPILLRTRNETRVEA